MLRVGMQTDKGPIILVGITEENIIRMRAGMPLDINLKDIAPPGARIARVYIGLNEDYEHLIDEMDTAGLPITDELRKHARKLDHQLKHERRERGRNV